MICLALDRARSCNYSKTITWRKRYLSIYIYIYVYLLTPTFWSRKSIQYTMNQVDSTLTVKFQFNRDAWKQIKSLPRVVGVADNAVSSLATISSTLLHDDANVACVTASLRLMPGRSTTVYLTPSTVELRVVSRKLETVSGNEKKNYCCFYCKWILKILLSLFVF